MTTFSQEIIWHSMAGRHSVSVEGCDSREEALSTALRMAKQGSHGWTPPRWWQWWRWGDRNYEAV
jgi:hypothetical protein